LERPPPLQSAITELLKDKEKCPKDRIGSTATNIFIWKIHFNEK